MANENITPISADQDAPKPGNGSPADPQPVGDPSREGEEKSAPGHGGKSEPVRS